MYCIIKYGDNQNNSSEKSLLSKQSIKSEVIYENREILINPNCYIQILIEYLYDVIKLDTSVKFDLCDESGQLMKIANYAPNTYATTILKYQEVYFIVLYEMSQSGKYQKLEPLLYRNSKQYLDINLKLKRHLSVSKRILSKQKIRKSSDRSSTKSLGSQANIGYRHTSKNQF